ncbi:MAG: hypothetical protein MJA29_00095, partial [Candidatus Omnitrophica bacterium]|nr:hypothetical protein [Candidatus Omnitrophota bacterium]
DKREAGICIKCHRKGSITFKGQWYCRQHYDEALETIVSPDESLVQKHVAKLRTILANGNGPMKQHLVAEVNRMQSSLEKSL